MPGTYHINQDIRPCPRPIYMYLVCQHGACERGKYVYGVWPKKPHIVNDKMQERSRYFTTCCVEREDPPPQSSSRRVLVSVVFPGYNWLFHNLAIYKCSDSDTYNIIVDTRYCFFVTCDGFISYMMILKKKRLTNLSLFLQVCSLQSSVSTIQTVVLTADVFQLFIKKHDTWIARATSYRVSNEARKPTL